MTPLHIACREGMAEITQAFLTSAKSQKFLQVIGYSNFTSDCEALINSYGDHGQVDIKLAIIQCIIMHSMFGFLSCL